MLLQVIDQLIAKWHLRRRDKEIDKAQLPDPSAAAGTDLLPDIKHIVILMMENHSFDNYFGTLGRGNGLPTDAQGVPNSTNPAADGSEIRSYPLSSPFQEEGVPTQSWRASHIQFADGTNQGFIRSVEEELPGRDPRIVMGYWTEQELPFYAGLARTFPLIDRWFCSCLGPTFPNRRFLIAATANGLIDDIPTGMIDYPKSGTIFDLLDRYGKSWINYHHVTTARILAQQLLGAGGLRGLRSLKLLLANFFPRLLLAVEGNIQFTASLFPLGIWRTLRHLRSIDRFWRDAESGQLPSVSIVDPDFQRSSEENPQNILVGAAFASKVINAVMQGKGWPHTLLIWIYDEHGGYYDHVPPPPAVEPDDVLPKSLLQQKGPLRWVLQQLGIWKKLQNLDTGVGRYNRYGFRVPAVVVSPYAKPGYVSPPSTAAQYDHTSVLKLIEQKWNLPPLTRRDAAAADLLETVDFNAPPSFLNPPSLPQPLPLVN